MGDPRRTRRKYQKPAHPWEGLRIEEEKEITKEYGLKNKKEIWKAQSKVRSFARLAKKITSSKTPQALKEEKELLNKLFKYNLLSKDAKTEDILSLETKHLLERRLQTIVFKKGLTRTMNQARQAITHGHVSIDNKKVDVPSYLVSRDQENKISLSPKLKFQREEKVKEEIKKEKEEIKNEKPNKTTTKV